MTHVPRCTLRLALLAVLAALSAAALVGQIKPAVGIRQNTPAVHAFTNARVVVSPGITIDRATIVIRDGIITAVGKNAAVPALETAVATSSTVAGPPRTTQTPST